MRYLFLRYVQLFTCGLVLSVMSLLFLGCSTLNAADTANVNQQINRGLDGDAVKEAWRVLDANFTKCGPYYYSYQHSKIVYYKNPESRPDLSGDTWEKLADVTPIISPREVTDADYRNGLRWKGEVWFRSSSVQTYTTTNGKGSLSKWSDGNVFFRVPLTKEVTAGWKGFFQRTAVDRTIMIPYYYWLMSTASEEYRTNQSRPCSGEEQKKILELDSKKVLCELTGENRECGEINCQEVGYKKVECSQIPEPLLK